MLTPGVSSSPRRLAPLASGLLLGVFIGLSTENLGLWAPMGLAVGIALNFIDFRLG